MAIPNLDRIEHRLKQLSQAWPVNKTSQAMTYALLGGGKRLRPRLVLSQVRTITDQAIDVACALEMIHTYSLIHDDLPALDNDDLRRGRPTVHKAFDEATAILAGDGLLNAAFETILKLDLEPAKLLACCKVLADSAGIHGMIGGQDSDLFDHLETKDSITSMYVRKTGKLLGAALALGAIVDDRNSESVLLMALGETLGVLFQIQDDVLELTQTTQTLGKSNLSDANNEKMTIVALHGMDAALIEIETLSQSVKQGLMTLSIDPTAAITILDEILVRNH
jgi:geranylgeranyl diphosphate synthase, type II